MLMVAHTLQEARDHMAVSLPDLIIADLRLPDGQGSDLLSAARDDATMDCGIGICTQI